jgi:hypothetical protein
MKQKNSMKWETIAEVITSETAPIGDGAPYGFATRVVSQWRAARRDETLRRWSLWSLRAALCSTAVCGLVMMFSSRENDSSILLQPPSAEFIALPLSIP